MKELETEFIGKGEVRGFLFRQLLSEDNVYLYEVTSEGQKWYEVFERKVNSLYNNVMYPSSKAFGIWAYTTPNYERSLERVAEIKEKVKSRK